MDWLSFMWGAVAMLFLIAAIAGIFFLGRDYERDFGKRQGG